MTADHYDALVVGAGPAGSIAALVLARAGARVALVDKARFPRDKACGDLVGPRGVQTLTDLGIEVAGPRVGDMEVVGPSGRQVLLRAFPGLTYPGHALVVPRVEFDDQLRQAAITAGAAQVAGRASSPLFGESGELRGFSVDAEDTSGAGKDRPLRLTADVVVGADGATSRVAAAAGLVNERQVLWGFAVRSYGVVDPPPPLPRIYFWEPQRWSGYPGYGWVFPGSGGTFNAGVGVGARGDRRVGMRASKDLPAFLASAGIDPGRAGRPLGGWLKMGMTGTIPAGGRTLLVGDAAGLVNSLQGEGISQALGSGRCAAEAILSAGPGGAARVYKADLARLYAPYACATAPITAWMLRHHRAVSGLGRVLTNPAAAAILAGGWSVYWNDLLDGASPGRARRTAAVAARAAGLLTARASDRRCVLESLESSAAGGQLCPEPGDGGLDDTVVTPSQEGVRQTGGDPHR
ncbi:MAG TPA: geranylgeranyl reductase family protein [Acidimicrobiales bacterium]|nr:geranylgeranyl reductase family protein [Acidimicrobiales bacterium]